MRVDLWSRLSLSREEVADGAASRAAPTGGTPRVVEIGEALEDATCDCGGLEAHLKRGGGR